MIRGETSLERLAAGDWLEHAAKSAAWWKHKLIVDPVKLMEPVWKNSGTLAHVFSAAGAPPSVLLQPSSPHTLVESSHRGGVGAHAPYAITGIETGHSSGSVFFLDQHIISLSIFVLICILCLCTGSSLYILVLGEKLAVLALTPPLVYAKGLLITKQ